MPKNTLTESPTKLLEQLDQVESADLANEVAKTYEAIEQVYMSSLGTDVKSELATTTNS